mgnify:CR=1 FL=1
MSEKQFFTVNAKGDEAELLIYEEIGEGWFGGVGAKGFAEQVKALGKGVGKINVRINSVGGNAFDGATIYNTLKNHPAKVHVHIDGAAISAASQIAMAGDEIEMADNAVFMAHKASGGVYGKVEELRSYVNLLEKVNDGLVNVYASRTGQTPEQITEWLDEERWFSAAEAVEFGFATKVSPAKAIAAKFDPKSAPESFKKMPDWCKAVLQPAPDNHVPPAQEPPKMADDPKPADPVNVPAPDNSAAIKAAADKAREEGIAAENHRVTEITAMCETAKLPGEAKKLIADNKMSVEAARKYLFEAMCQQRPAVGDEGGEGEPAPKDENAAYKKEYAENKAYFVKTGTTEEQYVRTRRIDDGLDPLILRASA